jgi:predicted nuclease of restriction endonuclease-like (RecB) superfamily
MAKAASKQIKAIAKPVTRAKRNLYHRVLTNVVTLLESARHATARSINAVMTTTYWEIGRRIVEFEQQGEARAEYGAAVIDRLSSDLTQRFGRGFSVRSLEQMRRFYVNWSSPPELTESGREEAREGKAQTVSALFKRSPKKAQTVSAQLIAAGPGDDSGSTPTDGLWSPDPSRFPLPWSHYVLLMSVEKAEARQFYETEAIRGGWSVRQLERQINTQFYERMLLSRKKAVLLLKGRKQTAEEILAADMAVKDPYVLEFLNLKDEYSESDLEAALVQNLEAFLMELGGDFTFVGRQKRLRIDDDWYRIDLLFFHRGLKCLVIIDLKLGKFTHADAGQMHLYLNYAREHWMKEGENPPIGIILCASKGQTLVRYALDGLPNKILAAEYKTALPSEAILAKQLDASRKQLEARSPR